MLLTNMKFAEVLERTRSLWNQREVVQGPDYSPLGQKQSLESVEEQVG